MSTLSHDIERLRSNVISIEQELARYRELLAGVEAGEAEAVIYRCSKHPSQLASDQLVQLTGGGPIYCSLCAEAAQSECRACEPMEKLVVVPASIASSEDRESDGAA